MTAKIILDNTPVFKVLTQTLLKSPADTKIYASDDAFILCKKDELESTIKFINNMDKINDFCLGSSYEYFIAKVVGLDDEICIDQPGAFGYVVDLNKFIKAFMCANDTVPIVIPTDFNIIKALRYQPTDDCSEAMTFTVHSINI